MTTKLSLETLNTYEANILKVYLSANTSDKVQGMEWYKTAGKIADNLAVKYQQNKSSVCGVIAALSPGCPWENNLEYTERALQWYNNQDLPRPNISIYGKANEDKAYRILSGEHSTMVLGGDKVTSFYLCLVDQDNECVVIDRHAVSIAVGQPLGKEYAKYVSTRKKYGAFEQCYVNVAKMLDIKPHQLQAITWVTWRRINNGMVDKFMDANQ
jgi:hypothetical protein